MYVEFFGKHGEHVSTNNRCIIGLDRYAKTTIEELVNTNQLATPAVSTLCITYIYVCVHMECIIYYYVLLPSSSSSFYYLVLLAYCVSRTVIDLPFCSIAYNLKVIRSTEAAYYDDMLLVVVGGRMMKHCLGDRRCVHGGW